MKKTFLETTDFTDRVLNYLSDERYIRFQQDLSIDPDKGRVIPGCGGLRKLRISDPRRGKGKRGGARVIYFHVEEADTIFLVTIYGKDEKDDLSPQERKILSGLAEAFKSEAISRM